MKKLLAGERGFGLLFAAVFLWVGVRSRSWLTVGISAACCAVALLRPALLRVPNQWWMRFAELLARVTHPIMMAALFYGVITPAGFAVRAAGRDSLRRRRDPRASTYWLERDPPGPMTNQY